MKAEEIRDNLKQILDNYDSKDWIENDAQEKLIDKILSLLTQSKEEAAREQGDAYKQAFHNTDELPHMKLWAIHVIASTPLVTQKGEGDE